VVLGSACLSRGVDEGFGVQGDALLSHEGEALARRVRKGPLAGEDRRSLNSRF